MGSIGLAFRAFIKTMFSAAVAERVRAALDGETLPKLTTGEKSIQQPGETSRREAATEPPPKRSEAITLLAALQREARLVDLIQQPLKDFSDEQIGAAARNVLTDSATALARFFSIRPVLCENEGEQVQVSVGYDAGRYKLSGNVGGSPPYRGRLAHAGWEATTVSLPTWTGSKSASLVIAPAEVEI